MEQGRKRKLEKNFFKIFFINSLLNVKMINIVLSLFYVYRGLQLSDIFYLGVVYSVAVLLSEVPSSYLADSFGRKRAVILASFFGILHWVFFLIADSFVFFAIGTVFYALAESFMSGTDEALVYDTNKELGNPDSSLQKLSRYFSSERIFKIASALIGAIIAQNLVNWQFNIIIFIDIAASLIAVFFALTLVEPKQFTNLEKQEAGLITDAYVIIANDKKLRVAILSKSLIFTAAHVCWVYMTVLFVDRLNVPLIVLGVVWSMHHIVMVVASHYLHNWLPHKTHAFKINFLNYLFSASVLAVIICWFSFPYKYLLLFFFLLTQFFSAIRRSIFSDVLNKQFKSYNRATALSLANFAEHIFFLPILPLAGFLISLNIIFPYFLALVIGLTVMWFFRLQADAQNFKII